MKVRFILSFLAALFIAGNMIAIESTDRVERKLPVVLKGEVPTTTHRSIPVIPINASVSTDDNIVEIIFTAPLGEVKILVDGQVQEVCQVTAPGQTTSFSIEGWAPGIYHLIAARLFLGVAIGISSFAVPLYIAEVSPAKSRGMFVAMFQLMITIGLLVSYLSDLYFADETSVSCWRPMFYVGVIPAIILFVGMLLVPPSPRWLMSVGREEESLSVLKMVEHPDLVNASFEQMRNEMRKNDERQGCFKDLAQPWNALVIAIGIMFFQQFVGINTVIYYSPKIFLMAGFDGAVSAIGASVGVGVVNLLFTLLSVYFVDRLGRRKLYFLGLSGIVISLLLLATSFIFAAQLGDSGKWLSIVLIFLYVGFFAISIGPLGWLIVSEVFPQKLRGLGTSLGSLSVWFFNAIVSFTFFKILKVFSISGTELTINGESQGNPAGAFLFYAFIGIVAIIWGYFYVSETKGVSLENIEAFWRKGGHPKDKII